MVLLVSWSMTNIVRCFRPQSAAQRAARANSAGIHQGFALLSNAATTAGELDTMTKEVIALAIGMVRGCPVSCPTRALIPYPARYPLFWPGEDLSE